MTDTVDCWIQERRQIWNVDVDRLAKRARDNRPKSGRRIGRSQMCCGDYIE